MTSQWIPGAAFGLLVAALLSCQTKGDERAKTGSQTNWLQSCDTSAECGGLECLCGVCLLECTTDGDCGDQGTARCAPGMSLAVSELCGDAPAPMNICLPLCRDGDCPGGQDCEDGVCIVASHGAASMLDASMRSGSIPDGSTPGATADGDRNDSGLDAAGPLSLEISTDTTYQRLLGFGGGIAYVEDDLVVHPDADALLTTLFGDSGFSIVRIRNRFEGDNQDDLLSTAEILQSATTALGQPPLVLINQGSPPNELKANGQRGCSELASCTLRSQADVGFDYAGLAEHWRSSLEAHAALGIVPDYLSIQNNPNWVPDAGSALEACFFLPQEGTMTLDDGGQAITVSFAGYRDALEAVSTGLASLASPPKIIAPDTSSAAESDGYTEVLAASTYDVVGFHMYGAQTGVVDIAELERLGRSAELSGHTLMQTEMSADGLSTAILAHHALTAAGAEAYLATALVSTSPEPDSGALTRLTDSGFELLEPYYALRHFARYARPGWSRVDTRVSGAPLLASAWLSPDEDALAVIVINPSDTELELQLRLPAPFEATWPSAVVERTVFGTAELGAALPPSDERATFTLPGTSVVTVSVSTEPSPQTP